MTVDGSRCHLTVFFVILSGVSVHAGRDSSNADALSLEHAGAVVFNELDVLEDSEGKHRRANEGDHQADMIEQLGREIAKNLAHELEDRQHSSVLPVTMELMKSSSEGAPQAKASSIVKNSSEHVATKPDATTGINGLLELAEAASKVKNSSEHVATGPDVTAGTNGLLELAEQLVKKLRHHGGDREIQSDHTEHSALATTATGVLEHAVSSTQDARHNGTSANLPQPHTQVLHAIHHRQPSYESQMNDVASDLMQLKAQVSLHKDKIGFAHALDMFQTIEASAKPCIDFNVLDQRMHSIPVGSLSRTEFLQICKKDGVYDRIDLDGSGKIDEEEYVKACNDKIIDGSSLSLASFNQRNGSVRFASFISSFIFMVVSSMLA